MLKISNDWDFFLQEEISQKYLKDLLLFLEVEYNSKTIYPPEDKILAAFQYTPLASIAVVILGQDPYIGSGQADGLAFSVLPDAKIPPSLKNIFKELATDIGCKSPNNGCLSGWAKQGVLLLNTILTVECGKSKSHANKGWERFTTAVLEKVNQLDKPVVYLLWGKDAQAKAKIITNPRHLVLKAAHPSPLAQNKFAGCNHFSQTNAFLTQYNFPAIDWGSSLCG